MQNENKSFISTMTRIVSETFYRLISYALSVRHQLFFSLYLVCKILMSEEEGGLAVEDYNALLRQQRSTQSKDIFDNQIKGKIFRNLKFLLHWVFNTTTTSKLFRLQGNHYIQLKEKR